MARYQSERLTFAKSLCSLFLLGVAAPLYAQTTAANAGADDSEAPDIVVTGVQFQGVATPLKLSLEPTSDTALVSSLSGDDVARQALGVNVDIFRSIPGVQVGDFGQVGIAQGVSLRGWPGANDSSALAFYLDGMQRNEGSNTAANGYLDIAPLIPQTIANLTVVKGPFDTRYGGNFALAGSAIATTVDYLPTGISISGGSYGNVHLLGTYGYKASTTSFYTAVQGIREDGYQRNANQKQLSTFSKITTDLGAGKISLSLQTYNVKFGSPGYLDIAEIRAGTLSPRASVDDTDGGKKNQYTLLSHYTVGDAQRGLDITAYAEHEFRERFATFTPYPQQYTSNNREHYGASVEPHFGFSLGSVEALVLAGASIRRDHANLKKLPSVAGEFLATPDPSDLYGYQVEGIDQTQYAGYASAVVKPANWLKLSGGGRYDYLTYDLDNQTYVSGTNSFASTHVKTNTGRFSFKGGAAVQALPSLTFIANIGQSFASPDGARGLITNPDLKSGVLVTKEAGVSFDPFGGRIHIAGNYYKTKFTNEVTFLGQTAINQGESRRRGFDVDASALVLKTDAVTFRAYGNYSYVHARLQSGDAIPNVAKWIASYGLHADILPEVEGENIVRFDIGQQLTGPQAFDTPVTYKSKTSGRVSTKLSYELPEHHNLKVWTDAIYYTMGRFDEFGFGLGDAIYVTSLPRFRFHIGASIEL